VRQRPDVARRSRVQYSLTNQRKSHMYIGGILGTILIIALIVYFVRRV